MEGRSKSVWNQLRSFAPFHFLPFVNHQQRTLGATVSPQTTPNNRVKYVKGEVNDAAFRDAPNLGTHPRRVRHLPIQSLYFSFRLLKSITLFRAIRCRFRVI